MLKLRCWEVTPFCMQLEKRIGNTIGERESYLGGNEGKGRGRGYWHLHREVLFPVNFGEHKLSITFSSWIIWLAFPCSLTFCHVKNARLSWGQITFPSSSSEWDTSQIGISFNMAARALDAAILEVFISGSNTVTFWKGELTDQDSNGELNSAAPNKKI